MAGLKPAAASHRHASESKATERQDPEERHVEEKDALDYVAGYTIMNDVSARDLQVQTSQWTAGKALDTFGPMGPGIVVASDIPDPQTLTLTTRVNGQVVQHASTADMIFSVATTIAFLSSLMTLEPGDIIATGTPSGVGTYHARSPKARPRPTSNG